jgi:hypothetical protein
MDIQPCSTVTTYRDDFGITWPTVKWSRQELHGQIEAAFDSSAELSSAILNEAQRCANEAVGAATIAALLTSTAASWPAAKAQFMNCASRTDWGNKIGTVNLRVESKCM